MKVYCVFEIQYDPEGNDINELLFIATSEKAAHDHIKNAFETLGSLRAGEAYGGRKFISLGEMITPCSYGPSTYSPFDMDRFEQAVKVNMLGHASMCRANNWTYVGKREDCSGGWFGGFVIEEIEMVV